MIIVGLGKNNHDDSVCAYLDGEIKYAKYEREINIKSSPAPNWWFYEKIKSWGVKLEEVSLFLETDRGSFYDNVERLPLNGVTYLDAPHLKTIILDHHFAHLFSNPNYVPGETPGMVVDAMGSGGNRSLIDDSFYPLRSKAITPGNVYTKIADTMKISAGSGNDYQDMAGKVMGLINYGKINKQNLDKLTQIHIKEIHDKIIEQNYFGENNQTWQDFIKNVDEVCYRVLRHKFNHIDIPQNKGKNIIYSGGVALNVEWNRRLREDGFFLDIDPAANDSGLSMGLVNYGLFKNNIKVPKIKNFPYIEDDEAPLKNPSDETINKVADLLSQNKIIGWYQGNGEYGPRALGNRSILMNPSILNGKDFLNEKIKHREWWRPYGAVVKEEKSLDYFDIGYSPYMLFTSKVLKNNIPAVTHVDNTCRHQTVNPFQNVYLYKLLDVFEKKTGIPLLLNTSLNEGGKPICSKIEQAEKILKNTELDYLCVGDKIVYGK
tara:strand:- start:421 stop:1890 length:1470 start_codon:yes stop_codon:yes gene_type:complete